MFGKNPIRPPVTGDGQTLEVVEIFPTLQGEGPRAGEPAIFVRLGGCNLACSFCDTEFEEYHPLSVAEIIRSVQRIAKNEHLAVITGGEPLRQPIGPLCESLIAAGFTVQIETNGTLYRELPEGVEIVCSPKNAGRGYFPVRPDLLKRVTAFKFLISSTDLLYEQVPEVGQSDYNIPVYVQPIDEYDTEKNSANLERTTQIVAQNGYKLSLQMHKILGIP